MAWSMDPTCWVASRVQADLEAATYVNSVAQLCGSSDPLQDLLEQVHEVLQVLSPDQISGVLTIGLELGVPCPQPLADGAGQEVSSAKFLSVLLGAGQDLAIEVLAAGRLRYWVGPVVLHHAGRLVYTFSGPGQETFSVAGTVVDVPPLNGQVSRYAVPYFLDLEDALENYGERSARYTQCPKLHEGWRDDTRLIFAPEPEHHMRDSLVYHLRIILRGYSGLEVMPEQNVNATRPVDIKIRWSAGTPIAMIEIKWLGKSAAIGAASWSSQYYAKRAKDGLQQLADYLDLYKVESPNMDARGYLVVFDGRRWGLQLSGAPISRVNAFKYEHVAIDYQAALLQRADMASPKRYFMEPAESGISA